jgi:hypothetical protein
MKTTLTPYTGGLTRLAFSLVGILALFAAALAYVQSGGRGQTAAATREMDASAGR